MSSDQWKALCDSVLTFRKERDWSQFHDPKNLAEAISIEAAELLEVFLWKTAAASRELSQEDRTRAAEEVADLQIYLINMADSLGIDLLEETERKLKINREKYPVEKAKGSATKYSRFEE